eukprot:1106486-Prymnesium_polylepis.1
MSAVTSVIIVNHGGGRNGYEYFCYMQNAVLEQLKVSHSSVLVIAPQFYTCNDGSYCDDTLSSTYALDKSSDMFWEWNSGWMKADLSSSEASGGRMSSFAVYDELLLSLESSGRLPNLKHIKLARYSGGGQSMQRYAVAGQSLSSLKSQVSFFIGSPSSVFYFD